jgi:DNA (cytosine-5)-methyltransferase 1
MKFIDLFAGIGGIRIPFDELEYECVFSSEIDKFARITYKENFKEEPYGDITKIDIKEIPEHNLLLAGFPCQPFSIAGLKKGFEEERGKMFYIIRDILKHHNPEYFLLENVKGLKIHNKGETLNTILKELKELDYTVYTDILSSKDYGIPQNRERLYIIGFKEKKGFQFPEKKELKKKVKDILEKEVDKKYTISDQIWKGHKERKRKHIEKGNGFGYNLVTRETEYTNTLSARYYKDGSEILINQENKNPRKLTPRECARLQGFPDTYKIVVSDTQAYKQFGNSVVIDVIREIAREMFKV